LADACSHAWAKRPGLDRYLVGGLDALDQMIDDDGGLDALTARNRSVSESATT
jgi:hypothetical protein